MYECCRSKITNRFLRQTMDRLAKRCYTAPVCAMFQMNLHSLSKNFLRNILSRAKWVVETACILFGAAPNQSPPISNQQRLCSRLNQADNWYFITKRYFTPITHDKKSIFPCNRKFFTSLHKIAGRRDDDCAVVIGFFALRFALLQFAPL